MRTRSEQEERQGQNENKNDRWMYQRTDQRMDRHALSILASVTGSGRFGSAGSAGPKLS